MVVEELRFVTTPSRAPEPWSLATMTGRDLDLRIIATSQRPASIDKDFLGNANTVWAGRMDYPEDAQAVAKRMRIGATEFDRLQDLDFIEYTPDRKIHRGRLAI